MTIYRVAGDEHGVNTGKGVVIDKRVRKSARICAREAARPGKFVARRSLNYMSQ